MNPAQFILISLVQLYRWTLSPAKVFLFGPTAGCRFTPSCAEYAQEAVRKHGAAHGAWFTARRICRCHPWGDCGHDPVPAAGEERAKLSRERSARAGKRTRVPIATSATRVLQRN